MIEKPVKVIKDWCADLINEALPKTYDEMLTERQFHALFARDDLSPFLPFGEIDDDGVWVSDNPRGPDNFMFAFELSPMIAAGDRTEEQITAMISKLPPRTVCYSLIHLNYDVVEDTENWFLSQRASGNDLMSEMAYRRSEFFLEWSEGKRSPVAGTEFRPRKARHLFVVKTAPLEADISKESYAQVEKTYTELAAMIKSSLETAGMGVKQLTGMELARFCVRLTNPQIPPKEWRDHKILKSHIENDQGISEINPLRRQMAGDKRWSVDYKDGVIEHEHLPTGTKRYSQVFTGVNFREGHEFHMQHMLTAIGGTNEPTSHLPGELYAFTMMEVLERKDVSTTIAAKTTTGTWSEGFENSNYTRRLFSRPRKQRENIAMLKRAFEDDNQVPVRSITGIVITSEDKERLKKTATQVSTLYGKKEVGITLKKEDAICFPMYLASLPGFWRHSLDGYERGLGRVVTMSAFNAATLCHFQGAWQGEVPQGGGAFTLSRLGSMVLINLFGSGANSFNFLTAATTGSGKSFFTNEVVRNIRAKGGKVRLFDAGGSYKNINAITGGKYIDFKISDPVCLNPFSRIHTKEDLAENLDSLEEVVTMLAFAKSYSSTSSNQNLTRKLPQEAINHINEAIEQVWEQKGASMSVFDLYEYFVNKSQESKSESERNEYRVLHQGLRVWAIGSKSRWMVGENNLELDNDFIVLELDGLSKDETLKAIVLYLLMQNVQDDVYINHNSDPLTGKAKEETLVVLDEAWALLDKPFCAEFIEKAYRQFRKFGASIGIITQGFSDVDKAQGGSGRKLLENCNWIFALKQNESALKQAADAGIVDIDDRQKYLIRSIEKNSDYSEFLVINTSNQADALCRFVTDKFTYAMYSSTAQQRAQIEKDVSKGMSRIEAVERLAAQLEESQMFKGDEKKASEESAA